MLETRRIDEVARIIERVLTKFSGRRDERGTVLGDIGRVLFDDVMRLVTEQVILRLGLQLFEGLRRL